MRVVLAALLAVVCLVLAGATFLVVAGPSELLREQLAYQVKTQTGRDLGISGASSFTFYPRMGVALGDVVLSDPPQLGGRPFVQAASLELAMPLGALLQRKLVVDQLVLKGAIIDLRVDAQGRSNWQTQAPVPAAAGNGKRAELRAPPAFPPVQIASADGAVAVPMALETPSSTPSVVPSLEMVSFDTVQMVDGTVRYLDERSGLRQEITSLNLKSKLPQAGGPMTIEGAGVWRNEQVKAQGSIASLKSLQDGAAPIALKLTTRAGESVFEGTVASGPVPQLNGRLKASTPAVGALANWLGVSGLSAQPEPGAPGALTLAGVVSVKPDLLAVRELVASLDGATAKGELSIVMRGARPVLRGALSLDRLDLNAALGGGGKLAGGGPPVSEAGKGAGDKGGIADLIEAMDKPKGKAAAPDNAPVPAPVPAQVRGWSTVAVDLSGLGLADADLKLDVGQLLYRDLVLDRTRIATTLRSGVLKAVFQEARLYKGRASGTLDLDTAKEPPRLDLQATLEGVEALPLLKAWGGMDRLAGRGTVALKVAGHGRTQQQIAESLTGTAAVTLADGAIVGFNFVGMMQSAQRGQMPVLTPQPTEKTDFRELSGTFAITNGVAQSQDMKLVSTALLVSGTGSVDLGRRQLDMQLRPKLTAGPTAQAQGLLGLNLDIPIHLYGPWDAPRAGIDAQNLMKDPKVKKGVEQIGEILKSKEGKDAAKEIGNAVRNLLGR